MPATRRRSSKSAVVSEVKKSTIVPKVSGAIYTRNSEGKMVMTETPTPPTKETRFAPTRPAEPKMTLEEYISDFKVRMQINNYEVMEFLEDCKRWYNLASPHVVKAFNYSKGKFDEFTATKAEDKTEN